MSTTDLTTMVKERANQWLNGNFDAQTKAEVKQLLAGNENDLIDAFYRDLEFGTGGLRGIMGAGTNRMNIYTVGMATQGFANYIKKGFPGLQQIKVAVAHDSRNNSRLFAETVAKIFAANGFQVSLFDALRPTPELSFAIRHLGCQAGVVITASHNPKEYNGYKAYWNDGGQVVPPHDHNIIDEVSKITSIDQVKWSGNDSNISIVGSEIDEVYTDKIKGLSLSPDIIERQKDLKIVYTPIHGSGVKLTPMILAKFGFRNVIHVTEQDVVDGNFPTVHSPNPEETAAMTLALEKAKATDADLVLATDPDADRVGVGCRNSAGEFILLNGNQAASVMINYLISKWVEKGKIKGNEYIVKTIVTTELLADIARKHKVESFDVLTGFKYIAEIIKKNEGKKQFIGGGEESYGYLAAEFVRDKDAVMACALIAETAAWAKDNGKTLYDVLLELYMEYGLYKESLLSVTKKGKSGAEEIKQLMVDFRNNPPAAIDGSKVVCIKDYQQQKSFDKLSGTSSNMDFPKSDVLQFFMADGTKISVRPSGTEPKIKYYFGVKEKLASKADYEKVIGSLDAKIQRIITELKLK